MSFETIEQPMNRVAFLSPEPKNTGAKLMAAIERTLHETIEVPETNKSEGSYWRQDGQHAEPEEGEVIVKLETKMLEVPEGPAVARPLTPSSESQFPATEDGAPATAENKRKKVYSVGDVWTIADGRVVLVRYIGVPNPPFLSRARNVEDRKWVGLEVVSGGSGKNAGKGPRGKRYFECPSGSGLFMRQKDFAQKVRKMTRHQQDVKPLAGQPRQAFPNHTKKVGGVTELNTRSRSKSDARPKRGRVQRRRSHGTTRPLGFRHTGSKTPQRIAFNSQNPFAFQRYDMKGLTTCALSQKDLRGRVMSKQGRDARPKSAPRSRRKAGPREIGRSSYKLASEMAGIKPMTASDAKEAAQGLAFNLRHDTKGFTATTLSQKNLYGASSVLQRSRPNNYTRSRKQGPREIGRSRAKLASEMAGIKPMSAQDSVEAARGFAFELRTDTKGFTSTSISQKDLYGHAKLSTGGSVYNMGRKLGPREIRQEGIRMKLASVEAGIKPMTAQQSAENARGLAFGLRHDLKGLDTMNVNRRDRYGHVKDASIGGGCGFGGKKLGPREIRRQGGRTVLASVAAGIKPMTAQQSAENARGLAFELRPDTKGFTSTSISQKDLYGHAKQSMGGSVYNMGRKMGPREIRHEGIRMKLASEQAGIKPMTAQQSAENARGLAFELRHDLKGLDTMNVNRRDRYGHVKDASLGGGYGFGGKKLGPREIRREGDRTVLASVAAGIKPMTAQESAENARGFAFALRYDTKGLTTMAVSQKDLYGLSKESTGGFASFGGKKLGPREIRREGGRAVLASVAAGIKPMTAQESAENARGFAFALRKDIKGLTTMAVSQKDLYGLSKPSTGGFAGFGGRKMGPRDIGRSNVKLASEASGIKPMTADESREAARGKLFAPMAYDTKGFTSTTLSQKDLRNRPRGGNTSVGRKAGPREIGRASRVLASEAAGIKPMTARQAARNADPNFTKPVSTTAARKGFSTTYK